MHCSQRWTGWPGTASTSSTCQSYSLGISTCSLFQRHTTFYQMVSTGSQSRSLPYLFILLFQSKNIPNPSCYNYPFCRKCAVWWDAEWQGCAASPATAPQPGCGRHLPGCGRAGSQGGHTCHGQWGFHTPARVEICLQSCQAPGWEGGSRGV